MKSVVITGMSAITAHGAGKAAFFEITDKLTAPANEISLFSTQDTQHHYAHQLADPDKLEGLPSKGRRTMDRNTMLAISATHQAIDDGKLSSSQVEAAGLVLGTEFGSLSSIANFDRSIQQSGLNGVSPMQFPNTVMNSPASQVNIRLGIRGLSTTITTAQTASLDSVGYAAHFVENDQLEVALAGGSEELCEMWYYAMHNAGCMNPEPVAYPLCDEKNGLLLGEGAAMFVVEKADRARSRNAAELAQVMAYSNGFAAGGNGSIGATAETVVRACLHEADICPDDIDLIYCNANGDNAFDRIIEKSLGCIFDYGQTLVASIKGTAGECLGASGALSIAAVIAGFQGHATGWRQRPQDPDPARFHTPVPKKSLSIIGHAMAFAISAAGQVAAVILKNPAAQTR